MNLIVDGNHMAHRMLHKLPNLGVNVHGTFVPTSVVYGLLRGVDSLIGLFNVVPLVVFDSKSYRRLAIDPKYKSHRGSMPQHFHVQLGWATEILIQFGVAAFFLPKFEADEVISIFASGAATTSTPTKIVSSDRDFYELLWWPRVTMYDPIRQREINGDYVKQTFGCDPRQIGVLRAIIGDPSDGIPGIRRGVGAKTALKWVTAGTLGNLSDKEMKHFRQNRRLMKLPTFKDLTDQERQAFVHELQEALARVSEGANPLHPLLARLKINVNLLKNLQRARDL